MSDFMIQQLETQRKKLDEALASIKSQSQVAVSNHPVLDVEPKQTQEVAVKVAQPNMFSSMFDQGLKMVLAKLGAVLNEEEQEWFSENLISVPGFLSSGSGKAVIRLVFDEFRAWMSK